MEKGTESGQPNDGEQGQPSPDTSQESEKQSSTQAKQLAATLLEEMRPAIREEVEQSLSREQQSFKDKRLHDLSEGLTSLEGAVEEIRGRMRDKGLSFDEAADEVQSDFRTQTLERRLEELEAREPSDNGQDSDGTETGWAERQATILSQAGLTPDNPRVVELRRRYDDPKDYIQALEQEAWNMARNPGGSKADMANTQEGAPPSKDLREQYNEEKKSIRAGDVSAINDLKRKYRGKGLEIW